MSHFFRHDVHHNVIKAEEPFNLFVWPPIRLEFLLLSMLWGHMQSKVLLCGKKWYSRSLWTRFWVLTLRKFCSVIWEVTLTLGKFPVFLFVPARFGNILVFPSQRWPTTARMGGKRKWTRYRISVNTAHVFFRHQNITLAKTCVISLWSYYWNKMP